MRRRNNAPAQQVERGYSARESGKELLELAIPTTVLSVLACRNITVNLLLDILRGVRNEPLLPAITAIIGYWAANYLQRRSLRGSPSELKGDCVILEDVYQSRRMVSLRTSQLQG